MTVLPRDCSASLMFSERGLPTCKTNMTSVMNSCDVNMHSIVRSDRVFVSPMWQHWSRLLYVHPFYIFVSLWLHIMDLFYPQ